jgi:PKD repeat protein
MPGEEVFVRALCIDQNAYIQGLIDWGDGSIDQILGECSGIHQYSTEGDYTIRLIVQDSAPQPLSNTASITVKVRYGITPTNMPPVLDISLSSTSGEAPFSTTLYIGVADVDGSVAEVKVDWGDGKAEILGDTDKIGERDGRKLYKKEHQYTSQGEFTVTVIAKDDKGEVSMKTETVKVSSSKPILSVKFKDHTNQDPNGKTYNIDMNVSSNQVTISADILAYDITPYDIVEVLRADYADGSTMIIIDRLYTVTDLKVENNRTIITISPDLIYWSPMNPWPGYSSGITINATVTIYAVKSGIGVDKTCSYPVSYYFRPLSECENIINTIKNHPSTVPIETKFTVKPK